MTLQEIEASALQLIPQQKRHLIQILTESLQDTEPDNAAPTESLTQFFQHSPLAAAIDELDLSRDRCQRLEIVELFGTIDYDETFDYKTQRQQP
ncbi:MAG: hypothetical protein ACFB9N_10735 [Geitlerinemataceae cyanobacterium]